MPADEGKRDHRALARELWEREFRPKLKKKAKHPRLYILSGLPLSGKSYFARRLIKRSTADIAYIQNDLVRESIVKLLGLGQPVHTKHESALVFDTSHEIIRHALAGGFHAVFDATNLLEKYRAPIYGIADEAKAEVLVIRLTVNRSIAEQRDAMRTGARDKEDRSKADLSIYDLLSDENEPIKKCTRPYIELDTSVKSADSLIDEYSLALK